jgi:hypothetical protein
MEIHTIAESRLAALPLSAIDLGDQTFQITAEMEISALIDSISRVGILNPPRVISAPRNWRVVSGFRRIMACAALGTSEIQAWQLGPDTTEATCALMAIADNALHRSLTLIEQVRASRLLVTHFGKATDLKSIARGVGLPPNLNLLGQLASLSEAPAVLAQAMTTGTISLPMALDLMGRPAPDRAALAAVFSELRPSLNRQRELVGLLDDIALRDDLSLAQVLAEAIDSTDTGGGGTDQGSDRSARFGQLRAALRARRYPNLVDAEKVRNQKIKRLKLGAGMQLVPPANFEGRRFELKLAFNTLAELRSHHDACKRLLHDPSLADLLS